MFQLFKPLTERQYTEKDLETYRMYERELVKERDRIIMMLQANTIMIEKLAKELENMK